MSGTVIIKNGNEIIYNDRGIPVYVKFQNGFEVWREFDDNGNLIHAKNSRGYESWSEYDENGNKIHWWCSDGREFWYDSDGKMITKEQYDKIHGAII